MTAVTSKPPQPEAEAPPLVRVGIDENGLGPRLGPLIVTAVTARTRGEGHRLDVARRRPARRHRRPCAEIDLSGCGPGGRRRNESDHPVSGP